jgi:murein DD-endopeptidase MepM/ murein hydrolase activator NlpD
MVRHVRQATGGAAFRQAAGAPVRPGAIFTPRPPLRRLLLALAAALLLILGPGLPEEHHAPPPLAPGLDAHVIFELLRERSSDPGSAPAVAELLARLSYLVSPIAGARPSRTPSHLPGARRAYRGGEHLGLDYYDGACGVRVTYGMPVRAAAGGWVVRADVDYLEPSPEIRSFYLEGARLAGDADPRVLDPLHGRQVWILHPGGILTRYTHLAAVWPGIRAGAWVLAEQPIGRVGNSGTSQGALGSESGAHLHFEIYLDWRPALRGLPRDQVLPLLERILGPD